MALEGVRVLVLSVALEGFDVVFSGVFGGGLDLVFNGGLGGGSSFGMLLQFYGWAKSPNSWSLFGKVALPFSFTGILTPHHV